MEDNQAVALEEMISNESSVSLTLAYYGTD